MKAQTSFGVPFFAGLIDYAGLFPPAKLPLEETLQNYREYLDGEYEWILSKCILTMGHLVELQSSDLQGFSEEKKLAVSLISRALSEDIPTASEIVAQSQGRLEISSIETVLGTRRSIRDHVARDSEALALLKGAPSCFYEVPASDNWEQQVEELLGVLAEVESSNSFGFKLRCGGVTEDLFPSVPRVAFALSQCVAAGVPMKFTAGLHHPFRHQPPKASGLTVSMHGYVNIFFAGFLAAKGILIEDLCRILSESEDTKLKVTMNGVEWLGFQVATDEIRRFRREHFLSYGSCSFVEPIEDAVEYGWLE